MTLTLELTPEQEARLNEAAQQQGIPPADVVAALLDGLPAQSPASEEPVEESMTWGARKLAELKAAGALGLWQDRPEDSPELARKFRKMAETRGPLPYD